MAGVETEGNFCSSIPRDPSPVTLIFLPMRFLLLLLTLIRVAPVPISGPTESHCAEAAMSSHAQGATGAPVSGHGHKEHSAPVQDCPHCPPVDCGQQTSCSSAPSATIARLGQSVALTWLDQTSAAPHALVVLRSVAHSPPTRPPASHLA